MEQNWCSTFVEHDLLFLEFMCSRSSFRKKVLATFCRSYAFRKVWKRLNLSDLQKVAKSFFKNSICSLSKLSRQGVNPRSYANLQVFTVIHFFKFDGRFQKLGVSDPIPHRLALPFEWFKSRKGYVFIILWKTKSQGALNHVLIQQKYRTQQMLQIPLKNRWFTKRF